MRYNTGFNREGEYDHFIVKAHASNISIRAFTLACCLKFWRISDNKIQADASSYMSFRLFLSQPIGSTVF
jgi:hypothetical protein